MGVFVPFDEWVGVGDGELFITELGHEIDKGIRIFGKTEGSLIGPAFVVSRYGRGQWLYDK